jgi:hypothetical protein
LGDPGAEQTMSGRDVITWLVGFMLVGVIVWSVTAWVYTSATMRVSAHAVSWLGSSLRCPPVRTLAMRGRSLAAGWCPA